MPLGSGHLETMLHDEVTRHPGGIAERVRDNLARWRIYHFHDTSSSSPMKKTADVNDNRYLRSDGANIAAFLFLLREKHQAEYELIRGTVQRVAPFFDDFVFKPESSVIKLAWQQRDSDYPFDVSQLSDGSLRFICLATALLQPDPPSTIIIDEPELGLQLRRSQVL